MLEAILLNKTQFLTNEYLHGHHRFEDPITSMVFGELDYISPHESHSFFSHFFERKPPRFTAETIAIHFWKKLKINSSRWVDYEKWNNLAQKVGIKQHVEPDLIIEYMGASGERVIYLIEVKWNSPEGENELFKQWEILNDEVQEDTVHVFLVKFRSNSISRPQVTVRFWDQFASDLNFFVLPGESRQFSLWRKRTVDFLAKVHDEFPVFSGFSNLSFSSTIQRWSYTPFDVQLILDYYKSLSKDCAMPTDAGNSIREAAEIVTNVWTEVLALEREVQYLVSESLDEYFRDIQEGERYDENDSTLSVCIKS